MIRIALLFFSSFLFLGNTQAQYEPMAVEGAHWVVFALSDDGTAHHAFVVRGDTVWNGTSFKKVYHYKIETPATIPSELLPPYSFTEALLIGGIRDDIAQRKVYAIAFADESWSFPDCDKFQEQLLYDFSLSTGDTLNGCLHSVTSLLPIVVDSVTTGFYWGKDRNILATELGAILEGFGTASGPFTSLYDIPTPGNPFQPVDYCIGSDMGCGFSFVDNVEEIAKESWLYVYPNPGSINHQIMVKCPPNMVYPVQFTAFNSLGSVVKELTINQMNSNIISLGLNGCQAGVYTLVLKSNNMSISQLLVIR